MKKIVKGIVVSALAALATHSIAETSVSKAEEALLPAGTIAKTVAYSVEVMRDGKSHEMHVIGLVGAPLSTTIGSGSGDTNCTLVGAHGQRYRLQTEADNKLSVTILPAKDEDGVITTVVQGSESRAALAKVTIVNDCVVPSGHAESSSFFDVAAMRKGQKRTLELGNGTTVAVKLISIDS